MKNKTLIKISIFLPLVSLLASWIQMEFQIRNNSSYIIPVAGYDPRDILRGHYVNYTIKWDFDKDKVLAFIAEGKLLQSNKDRSFNNYYVPAFLCVAKVNNSLIYYPMFSKKSDQCLDIIKGNVAKKLFNNEEDFQFTIPNSRFYIPEDKGEALQNLMTIKENVQISFVVSSSNQILVKDLLINGKSWRLAITER